MLLRILAVGNKMPSWVEEGFHEYAKRFPPSCSLELIEIAPEKRTKTSDIARIKQRESEKILAAIKPGHRIIALDVLGKSWSTEQLAQQVESWHHEGRNTDL